MMMVMMMMCIPKWVMENSIAKWVLNGSTVNTISEALYIHFTLLSSSLSWLNLIKINPTLTPPPAVANVPTCRHSMVNVYTQQWPCNNTACSSAKPTVAKKGQTARPNPAQAAELSRVKCWRIIRLEKRKILRNN